MIFRIALAWLALSTAALAQTPSTVRLCNGTQPNCPLVGPANGLPVNVVGGTTGGGPVTIADGADVAEGAVADAAATAGSAGTVSAKLRFLTSVAYATSTNQTSQITQETAINTILGLQADAACSTDNGTCTIAALQKRGNQRFTTINTTLGSPFQAGGSIGNTTFGATQGTSPWVVGGNGTAGTAAIGVLTIQGIASMTPVQVSQATASNLNATVVGTGTFATQSAITAASGSFASGAFASGSFASGSHASGSFASGAFASGSVASGAYASGSLASGAMVDLVASQTPVAAGSATATKGLLLGGQYDSTQKTLTTGQQAAFSASPRGAMFVAVGADGFAVTNAGTFATQAAITAASGSIASGAMVDLGAQADSACATDNGTCSEIALIKRTNQRVTTLNTTLGTPMQATGGTVGLVAGTALAGKFGIDQTTPGTTNAVAPIAGQNGVQGGAGASTALTQRVAIASDANTVALAANQSVNVAQINGVTPLMGNGATGTGAVRVSIANDSTGIVALPAAGTSIVGTKAAGTAGATSALVGAVYNSTAPTLTDGQQAAGQADTAGSYQVNTEGKKATYSAIGSFAPAAGATGIATIVGSSTKTIRVTRIQVSGIATAASAADIGLVMYSSAYSGGTSSLRTAVPHDSASAAATAVVRTWTASPTAGSSVGYVRLSKMTLSTSAGAIPIVPIEWLFTTRNSQGIVLRGTAQYLSLDWNAQTITGNSLNIDIEWTEE